MFAKRRSRRTAPGSSVVRAAPFGEVPNLKPRIGFCRTPYWTKADRATQAALESAAPRLAAAGARVAEVALDGEFADLAQAQIRGSGFEFYRALAYERTKFPEQISEKLRGRLLAGGRVTRAQYEEAQAMALRCRARLADVYRDYDVLLSPSTTGEAPRGLESTGDPVFGLSWTLMLGPAVTLPVFTGPSGLPIGAQITGPRAKDALTLLCAEWVCRVLAQ